MPASRNISQKLLGGRHGTPRSNRPAGEIDPTKLGDITLNRDAIQALTIAQARVQVTISAGGTTAILVSEETGKQIGGLDDLAKLLGLRSFVTKEKKMSASSDLQQQITAAAFRASSYVKSTDPSFEQKKLDNSFLVAAKPYKAMADMINARFEPIKANYHDGSDEYKDILYWYCSGIDRAVALTLAEMVKGEKEKGKMDSFLFDIGVPAYVKNKLLLKSLAISKDTDLSRVLFPQDPSKGLALSVKEWRDKAFVKKQGPLMRNSAILINILQSDELFLELIGMTAEQFANAEDPKVQRVLKTRILVVPPFEDHNRVLEPLARPNFRGFGLPNTAMDQSRDRLANLCAVPIRAYAFSVRMAETITDFYDRFTPPGTIKPADDKLGNYAKQMLTALEEGVSVDLYAIIRLEAKSTALMEWIHRECKIIPNGDLSKKISKSLGIVSGNGGRKLSELPKLGKKPSCPIDLVSGVSTGSEKDAIKSFRSDVLSVKTKSTVKKRSVASSILTKKAKTFLKAVARDHSPMLAESMEAYFRGFYSEDIQSAAVTIAEARFDDLEDLSEVESSDGDPSDDEEGDE